jgi:ABC-type polysaccharide/polyol phosphate transport system ATPase subunit
MRWRISVRRGSTLSSEIVIHCERLSKTFVVRPPGLRGLIGRMCNIRFGHERLVEALRNVSFEVRRGDIFGIIGSNGAGKSTLLGCIAGVTPYDSGSLTINGRVDAILVVGVGFHPVLTGRENAVIGAIAMGLPASEAMASADDVIGFAELEKFADMPFYTYSSGMQARLQFAVAVNRTSDILIIDEALATGDAGFIRKSQRRIEELCTGGSTVLVVTHSLDFVERLCNRAILLERGTVRALGSGREVCAVYSNRVVEQEVRRLREEALPASAEEEEGHSGEAEQQPENGELIDHVVTSLPGEAVASPPADVIAGPPAVIARPRTDRGTGEVRLEKVRIIGGDNEVLHHRKPVTFEFVVNARERLENPRLNVRFYLAQWDVFITSFGDEHLDAATGEWLERLDLGTIEGRSVIRVHMPQCVFAGNTYWCTFGLAPRVPRRALETEDDWYIFRPKAAIFRVVSFPEHPEWGFRTCVVEPPLLVSAQPAEAVALLRTGT